MEFKTLFQILKKHLSDGHDVPYFFRNLVAMLTKVSKDEWGTSKDQSQEEKDKSLRNYTKLGLPKKSTQTIVYRLTPENTIESINSHSEAQRWLLTEELRGYDSDIDADNVAEKVTDWLVEMIQVSNRLVPQDESATTSILANIERDVNAKMKQFNDSFYSDARKASRLHFNSFNSYTFETPDDTGTGTNYKGMVLHDLAILYLTALPTIAHDSLIPKNISNRAIDGIMKIYAGTDKQVFITFDKQDSYPKGTRKMLADNMVLKLSDNNSKLYGES